MGIARKTPEKEPIGAPLRFFVLALLTRTRARNRNRHPMNRRFDHEKLEVYPLVMPVDLL